VAGIEREYRPARGVASSRPGGRRSAAATRNNVFRRCERRLLVFGAQPEGIGRCRLYLERDDTADSEC
jgi:hypothetical protein